MFIIKVGIFALCVLGDDVLLESSLASGNLVLRLDADHTATPVAPHLVVAVVVAGASNLHKLGKVVLVLSADTSQGNRGGSLLVHQLAQARLALHNNVRDVALAAQGGKPENKLSIRIS